MANQYGPTGRYPGGPSGNRQNGPGNQELGRNVKWPWIGGGIVVVVAIVVGIVLDATGGDTESTASGTTSTTNASVATLSPEEVEAWHQPGARSPATTNASVATLSPEEIEAARQRSAESAARQEAARAAAAATEAARFDPNTYEHIGDRDLALIARDPTASRGRKIVIYGDVTQADAATGNSRIRVNAAGSQYWNWYDFDENAVISVTNPTLLSNVVEDDLVQLYVEVKGPLSYNTTLGGSTTVPEFTAYIVNVYGSN